MNFVFAYLNNKERVQLANTCSWLNEVHRETPLARATVQYKTNFHKSVIELHLQDVQLEHLYLPVTKVLTLNNCSIDCIEAPNLEIFMTDKIMPIKTKRPLKEYCTETQWVCGALGQQSIEVKAEKVYVNHCCADLIKAPMAEFNILAICDSCGPARQTSIAKATELEFDNEYINDRLCISNRTTALRYYHCTFQNEPRYPAKLLDFAMYACNALWTDVLHLPFQNLRVLDLRENFTLTKLPWIPKYVESLDLMHTGIDDYSFLKECRKLTKLSMTVRKAHDMLHVPLKLESLGLCLKEPKISLQNYILQTLVIHTLMPNFTCNVDCLCSIGRCPCISNS